MAPIADTCFDPVDFHDQVVDDAYDNSLCFFSSLSHFDATLPSAFLKSKQDYPIWFTQDDWKWDLQNQLSRYQYPTGSIFYRLLAYLNQAMNDPKRTRLVENVCTGFRFPDKY